MNESLAEYDRQQDTLLKENKRLLTENEDLEKDIDEVKREERTRNISFSKIQDQIVSFRIRISSFKILAFRNNLDILLVTNVSRITEIQ